MLKYAWDAKSFGFRTWKMSADISTISLHSKQTGILAVSFIFVFLVCKECSCLPISVNDQISWSEPDRSCLASVTASAQARWTPWGACIQLGATRQRAGRRDPHLRDVYVTWGGGVHSHYVGIAGSTGAHSDLEHPPLPQEGCARGPHSWEGMCV